MITLHWHWIPFGILIIIWLVLYIKEVRTGRSTGMFSGIEQAFLIIALIVFLLIWGGVFWW